MSNVRDFPVMLAMALTVALVLPPLAAAEPGPARLVSKSSTEQADEAKASAISADGRYVAFEGSIGGLSGVFREDLETSAIVRVASGSAPSISADGRYVSFTTSARLDPADDLQASSSDVYVADMSTSPPTYELASALDGSAQGLDYMGSGGAVASGRVSLSADGREVVFVTTAGSNLGGSPGDTPAGQVVLRNLQTEQTTLVSASRDPSGAMTAKPVPGGAVATGLAEPPGASLSADGTTVAWLGANLPAQVPLLADEKESIEFEDARETPYDEPLWRRVADGPTAPTRRIVGGGDPLFPGCPPEGTLLIAACQGPFPHIDNKNTNFNLRMGWLGLRGIDTVPQLSADGRTVALIGNPEEVTDLFLVDMQEGLSRVSAIRPLTKAPIVDPGNPAGTINQFPFVPVNGTISDVAISPDGSRVAFATTRQQFPLSPPNLITPAPGQLGVADLYLIDLEGETIERLTHGKGGIGEASLGAEPGASSPAFDATGTRLTFASTASNLVAGDANGRSDVFVLEDPRLAEGTGEAEISPPPPVPLAKPRWRLGVSARSLPAGAVRLMVVVPGLGKISVRLTAASVQPGKPRQLGSIAARALRAGPVALNLKLPRRYRALAWSLNGLYATVGVFFHGPGGKPLRHQLEVHFHARHGRSTRQAGDR